MDNVPMTAAYERLEAMERKMMKLTFEYHRAEDKRDYAKCREVLEKIKAAQAAFDRLYAALTA